MIKIEKRSFKDRLEGGVWVIKQLCPVCDGTLKAGKFCPVCKKWVRKPNVVDVNYYLNERHPVQETDCEYHGIRTEKKDRKVRKDTDVTAKKGKKKDTSQESMMSSQMMEVMKKGRSTGKTVQTKQKKKSGFSTVMIVLGIYLLIMFGLPIIRLLFGIFASVFW